MLFATSASAQHIEHAMQMGVRQHHDPAEKALDALAGKPLAALTELRELYVRYADVVASKKDLDGWSYGMETGRVVDHPDERILPARQAADAYRLRQAELRKLEDAYAAATGAFQDETREDLRIAVDKKRREARAARGVTRRTKGLDLDWSDQVWYELNKLDPEEWSVSDAVRDATPRHSSAVVCTPAESPTLCLAFDPWFRGEADVYEYDSWNEGSTAGLIPAEYFLHHLPERRKKA
jgi:hypothetical protein